MQAGERTKQVTSKSAQENCFLMPNAPNFFFFFTYKKYHHNKPKQRRHSVCHQGLRAVWQAGIYKPTAETDPGKQAATGVSKLRSLLTQRNEGVMTMINNMLTLNKKMLQNRNYYHTCPACRINIFNADFRIFFYIIEQAIKLMIFFARAECSNRGPRLSGAESQDSPDLDGQVRLSVLPRLAPARSPGSLSPRSSPPGCEVASAPA